VEPILLSPPDISPSDRDAIGRAFDSGWIAPVGPEVDFFERELAVVTSRRYAVALSSGTAALHLALLLADVGPGDRVLVSDLTFAATVNAIRYVGAEPVFIDSSPSDWNMDPGLLREALETGDYSACMPVDIYGQMADYSSIGSLCRSNGVTLIADSAESLGASRDGRPSGSWGLMAGLSFNGNKIITTSGGGALVTDSDELAERARFLATQARDPAPHYQHSEVGFNYRMSNLLAGLGRSQLADLERRVRIRREHNTAYRNALGSLPGIEFMPEAEGSRSTFWLTVLTISPALARSDSATVRIHLDSMGIEARPVWKPMHLQPVFEGFEIIGGGVSERLFAQGLCLPSGSSMTSQQRDRVIAEFKRALDD
jgi:pyridoxal phosphate-dependent aminotransferase EpsN